MKNTYKSGVNTSNSFNTPPSNWVKVKRKRKFDPVKASAPMMLETLMQIAVLACEKNDCRADIIAICHKAISEAKGTLYAFHGVRSSLAIMPESVRF